MKNKLEALGQGVRELLSWQGRAGKVEVGVRVWT